MTVLVYIDHKNGQVKKAAGETINYASKCGDNVVPLILGAADASLLAPHSRAAPRRRNCR